MCKLDVIPTRLNIPLSLCRTLADRSYPDHARDRTIFCPSDTLSARRDSCRPGAPYVCAFNPARPASLPMEVGIPVPPASAGAAATLTSPSTQDTSAAPAHG